MTHASVFSGIGGPELAAAWLGWDNVFHCEINEFGRTILNYWFPNSKSYEDITKTDFTEWRGKVDVLSGGFPCQPFSYAGQRRGADDDRYLWPHMFRCIDEIRPAWVVAENVAGVTTMVEQGEVSAMGGQASLFEEVDDLHRYRQQSTFTIERICSDLEGHGYSVQPVLVPACAVCAPHRRDRVFIIARRNDAEDSVCSGLVHRQHEEQGSVRHIRDACAGDSERICGETQRIVVADTYHDGPRGCKGEDGKERQDSGHSFWNAESDAERNGFQCKPRIACEQRSSSDSDNTGDGTQRVRGRERQEMDGGSEEQPLAVSCRLGERRSASDTESEQGGRCELGKPRRCKPQQEQFEGRGCENSTEWTSSNNNVVRLQIRHGERIGQIQPGHRLETLDGKAGLGRWDSFPTVSPVHRGNDGLPFDVDSLSIPFSKWRTESLKAYGNAIVPQVMYEIFRAIQLTTQEYEKA